MERAFDFNQNIPKQEKMLETPVQLFNQHLILHIDLAKQCIGEDRQVFAAMIPDEKKILLAKTEDMAFKAKHKPIMLFVKQKNAKGDKSISLQEFFADWPEISSENKKLDYQWKEIELTLEIIL
uniref:hypothetical protein n=1 Tax=Algoriphagus sp. TaxID=1872435 RepID=UPI002583AA26|nr:hypothetical protein [Algoriphagus sp.]